jgi:hypothetical protein
MMFTHNYFMNSQKFFAIRTLTCVVLGIFLLGTFGCCGETALERDYGKSWAYNEDVQIANPQAEFTETPATGLAPNASTAVMNAYNKSFNRKKSGGGGTTMINLGGITSGAGDGGGSSGGGDN